GVYRFASQGGVEGAVVRAENFGRAEGLVETAAAPRAAAPFLEGRVGPGDAQVGVDQGHAVGEHIEDVIGLEQGAGSFPDGRVLGTGVDAIEVFGAQQRQSLGDVVYPDDLAVRFAALQRVARFWTGGIKDEDSRSLRQRSLHLFLAHTHPEYVGNYRVSPF